MGKYEILRGMDGHYYFLLKADNGFAIAMSQAYTSKKGVEQAIEAMRRIAGTAHVVDKLSGARKSRPKS